MTSARLFALAAAATVVLGLGCQENVTAPGSCPTLCPQGSLALVDTTITGIVVEDTTYRGYYSKQEAQWMVVADADSFRSVALARFASRASTWYPASNDTAVTAGAVDSVAMTLYLTGRDTAVHGVGVRVYRLPVNFDTGMTWTAAQAYLADSLLVDTLTLPDSMASGSVTLKLRTHALDQIPDADGGVISLAFALQAPQHTSLALSTTNNAYGGPAVSWYVHAVAPRDTLSTVLTTRPDLSTFTYDPPPSEPTAEIVAGGVPSARALLHLVLPPIATDSSRLVRATLILTPTRPARGLPGESFRLSARGLLRDFGAKSVIFVDTSAGGTTPVSRGDTATIRIDIVRLLRQWGTSNGDSLPRALMLLSEPEAGGMGEVSVARRTAGAAAPRLQLTYVRPYTFGVP